MTIIYYIVPILYKNLLSDTIPLFLSSLRLIGEDLLINTISQGASTLVFTINKIWLWNIKAVFYKILSDKHGSGNYLGNKLSILKTTNILIFSNLRLKYYEL